MLPLAGVIIANVQVILLLFVRRGSTKNHRVAAIQIIVNLIIVIQIIAAVLMQTLTTTMVQTQTTIMIILGDVIGVMIPLILLNTAIAITSSKIFN